MGLFVEIQTQLVAATGVPAQKLYLYAALFLVTAIFLLLQRVCLEIAAFLGFYRGGQVEFPAQAD